MSARCPVLLLASAALAACTPRPTADLNPGSTVTPELRAPETDEDPAEAQSKSRWVDISIEPEFGCAVERTGSVFCWGRGPAAEMELRELPDQPPSDPAVYGTRKWGPASRIELVHDARRISTASSRACAVVEDGRVRCWGAVRWGSQHVYDVAGITDAVELEIGDGESCAMLAGGELWCWGAEEFGVPRPRLSGAVAMTVGDGLACGLTGQGDVVCWGQEIKSWHRYDTQFKQGQFKQGQASGGQPPTELDEQDFPDVLEVGRFRGALDLALLGWNTLCVLRGDGKTVCSTQDLLSLIREQDIGMREISDARGLAELATTRTHACARTVDGRAQCWGRNVYGQLGDGGSTTRESAAPVAGLDGVVELAVAEDLSCALTRDDRIACWGFDRGEALGRDDSHAHVVPDLKASSIAAFGRTTCAVDDTSALRCWGSDTLDQIGIAEVSKPSVLALPTSGDIVSFSTGWEACFLRSGGALQCGNWNAQSTGAPTFTPSTAIPEVHTFAAGPTPLCTIAGTGRKAALSCGQSFGLLEVDRQIKAPIDVSTSNMRGCVAHGSGQVSCFGELYSWNDQPPPREFTKIAGIRDAVAVSSSSYSDCALRKSGKVSCWVGQTETEWSTDGRTPKANHYKSSDTKDLDLDKITQLVAGGQHHCALSSGGAVRCWGDNPYSETTEWKPVPDLPDDVVELAAGNEHTCARMKSGEVRCWGDDVWGQLARVPTRVYLTPTVMDVP
ncbi:Regulator of chromosome condensation (RCC1) repeat protein [Enhygromyxa salina]|uniref:Regulator of chromosome condensation (RCC1) repeat protein n=1 Tax=Enhygromyxa salina TaxID=215803 RepID=A0A2S9YIY1_9BACT|nr:hypothetical protein [Enhygromyxa salina]PRQ05031.1 Regulator of chromosome condensation (RCC1) repeat protein [Enhygromyxa salina]